MFGRELQTAPSQEVEQVYSSRNQQMGGNGVPAREKRESQRLWGTHIPLLGPRDERPRSKGYWAGMIGGHLREDWRIGYTDGTRMNGMAA